MKTVNVGELRNQLSAYLQLVRKGEEVVVKDRNRPVARILPFAERSIDQEEANLIAEGRMKLPEREMDWDEFFRLPTGNVSREASLKAVRESRGDR